MSTYFNTFLYDDIKGCPIVHTYTIIISLTCVHNRFEKFVLYTYATGAPIGGLALDGHVLLALPIGK